MGLDPHRDRLCLVQLSAGDSNAHMVQLLPGKYEAPNLRKLLADPKVLKLFHFARADMATLKYYFGITSTPLSFNIRAPPPPPSVFVRTFTDPQLTDLTVPRIASGTDFIERTANPDWGAEKLNRGSAQ